MRRLLLAAPVVPALAFAVLSGCANDAPDDAIPLSAAGQKGATIVATTACATCHGADGRGAAASGFDGVWGTTITLDDGTTVVYDADFVTRAIRDPAAEKRAGSATVEMPAYDTAALSDEDLAAVLAFIEEMGAATG